MGKRTREPAKSAAPAGRSMVGRKAMGGLHGGGGYKVQARYIALQVSRWLREPAFRTAQPEGLEDLDVYFEIHGSKVRDHHQVKSGELNPSMLKAIVASFSRDLAKGARRLVIASPHATPEVRNLFVLVERVRTAILPVPDPDGVRARTEMELAERFAAVGLAELQSCIVGQVWLDSDFAALTTDDEAAIARIVGELGHLDCFARSPPDAMRVAAKALLDQAEGVLSRDSVLAALKEAVACHQRGPATAAGEVLVMRHQSFARIGQAPESLLVPTDLEGRRRVEVVLDSLSICQGDAPGLEQACQQVARVDGPLRQALDSRPDAPIVYYGFTHVPFGVLAGAVIGQQRVVRVLEHDRETESFTWPGGAVVPVTSVVKKGEGNVAVLRLSVSANVSPVDSVPREGGVGLELDVTCQQVRRGVVTSESSAREVVKVARALLDEHVSGAHFESLHVYAAVPVSVAFLLGRTLAASGLPRTFVYNFSQTKVPPYYWRLCLQDALAGRPAVEDLEKHEERKDV